MLQKWFTHRQCLLNVDVVVLCRTVKQLESSVNVLDLPKGLCLVRGDGTEPANIVWYVLHEDPSVHHVDPIVCVSDRPPIFD